MSIINQMLRELDARGGSVSDAPIVPATMPVRKNHPGLFVAAGLLVAAAGGGVYWMLSTDAPERPAPLASGMAAPAAPSAPLPETPVVVASVTAVTPIAPLPPTVAPVVAPEKPNVPAVPLIQMATSLSIEQADAIKSDPVLPKPVAAPAQVQTRPAVVKKMAELTPEAEAQQLYEEAQALRRAGKHDAATGKYQQALARNPGMLQARLQLASLMQGNGQTEAALQLLKAGYEQQPNDTLAIAAGRLLADQGQRDEALSWLERGRAGLRSADYALMGALLSQMQRFDESARAYQRALAADPDQGGWLLGLGLALEGQGRLDEARAAYRKALEHGEFKPEVVEFLRQKSAKPGG